MKREFEPISEETGALFRNLVENIPQEYLTELMKECGFKPAHEPLSHDVEFAVNRVIEEIHNNRFTPQSRRLGTNYEVALKMLKNSGIEGVSLDQLKVLVAHDKYPNQEVSKLIHRLNGKLEKFGYTIRRHSIYKIVPVSEEGEVVE